jgi:hypothetical protein
MMTPHLPTTTLREIQKTKKMAVSSFEQVFIWLPPNGNLTNEVAGKLQLLHTQFQPLNS